MNKGGNGMRKRTIIFCLGVAVLYLGLAGCYIGISGSAKLNADGSGVILDGQNPILVQAKQPAPPPPPPKPAPKPVLKAKVVGKKIEITEKVMFDYNKATIKVDSNQLLTDVATVLEKYPTIKKISIEGHTDSDGKAKYNKKLSQQRADAVKEFLVKAGIDESRMEAVGYGEEQPIASNDTDEGKEQNRRVEFNIIEGGAEEKVVVKPGTEE
jgi:outer membrane protein OmpA-like peptidoglycan-associated protein